MNELVQKFGYYGYYFFRKGDKLPSWYEEGLMRTCEREFYISINPDKNWQNCVWWYIKNERPYLR